MFSHVMVGANDVEKAKTFYDAILGALGHKPGVMDEKGRVFYVTKQGVFSISKPIDGEAATHANGGTIGFAAASSDDADKFHEVGLASGGTACEDPPGVRAGGRVDMYISYLRDPSGNKICALHYMT